MCWLGGKGFVSYLMRVSLSSHSFGLPWVKLQQPDEYVSNAAALVLS